MKYSPSVQLKCKILKKKDWDNILPDLFWPRVVFVNYTVKKHHFEGKKCSDCLPWISKNREPKTVSRLIRWSAEENGE